MHRISWLGTFGLLKIFVRSQPRENFGKQRMENVSSSLIILSSLQYAVLRNLNNKGYLL